MLWSAEGRRCFQCAPPLHLLGKWQHELWSRESNGCGKRDSEAAMAVLQCTAVRDSVAASRAILPPQPPTAPPPSSLACPSPHLCSCSASTALELTPATRQQGGGWTTIGGWTVWPPPSCPGSCGGRARRCGGCRVHRLLAAGCWSLLRCRQRWLWWLWWCVCVCVFVCSCALETVVGQVCGAVCRRQLHSASQVRVAADKDSTQQSALSLPKLGQAPFQSLCCDVALAAKQWRNVPLLLLCLCTHGLCTCCSLLKQAAPVLLPQWFVLNRKHAQLVLDDRRVEAVFQQHCRTTWEDDGDEGWLRVCFPGERVRVWGERDSDMWQGLLPCCPGLPATLPC